MTIVLLAEAEALVDRIRAAVSEVWDCGPAMSNTELAYYTRALRAESRASDRLARRERRLGVGIRATR